MSQWSKALNLKDPYLAAHQVPVQEAQQMLYNSRAPFCVAQTADLNTHHRSLWQVTTRVS